MSTHLTGTVRAGWTLCGIKVTRPEALPYMAARYLNGHRSGRHDLIICGECETELEANEATERLPPRRGSA